MRNRILAAALAAWGLAAGLIPGQPPEPPPPAPKQAVLAHAVEVRAGPSWQFAATGALERGSPVVILAEENGWLAIQPPGGASSWIANRFLKFPDQDKDKPPVGPQRAYVTGEAPVPVRLGRDGSNQPLGVEQVRLQPGAIVLLLGDQVSFEDTTWNRIQPPASEVRYVPKEALDEKATLPAIQFAGQMSAPGTLPGSIRPREPLLWAQAEQAERAGNYGEAEQLYQKLATELVQTGGDQELLLRCYNRMQGIRERLRAAGAPAAPVSRSGGTAYAVTAGRSSFAPATAARPGAGVTLPAGTTLHSSGPGWLRRTGFQIGGQPAYVLENGQGMVHLYVLPQTGVDLEGHLNQRVDLIGALVPRTDVRGSVMVVQRVNPVR